MQEQDAAVRRPRLLTAYMLALFLGVFGAHWFYLGRPAPGCARLSLTLVGFLAALAGFAGVVVPEIPRVYSFVSLATTVCWVVLDAS